MQDDDCSKNGFASSDVPVSVGIVAGLPSDDGRTPGEGSLAGVPERRLRALSFSLVDLHRTSRQTPLREFASLAFETSRRVVPFDAAFLSSGFLDGGVPEVHDLHAHELPPDFIEGWSELRTRDRVHAEALSRPGLAVQEDLLHAHATDEEMLGRFRSAGLAHALCTVVVEPRARTFVSVSLYRSDRDEPFDAGERFLTELLVPHVSEALRTCRLGQLGAFAKTSPHLPTASAVVDGPGRLIEAEPAFVEMLCGVFPSWSGPRLPADFEPLTTEPRALALTLQGLHVEAVPSHGLRLLRLRRATRADALTSRELAVAREFASGASALEVGRAMGIATNTVRVHLGRAYAKLGISSKAELAAILAAEAGETGTSGR